MAFSRSVPAFVGKIIFPTDHMAKSVAFYRGLKFEVENFDSSYAWVRFDGEEILHLSGVDGLDVDNNRAAGYLHVQDVDAIHEQWKRSVSIADELQDRPWGMREFSFRDPSNNLLRVGQNL